MEITKNDPLEKVKYYIEYIDYLIDCEQYNIAIKNIQNINTNKNFELMFKAAICYYKLDMYNKSIEEFNKCLELKKDDSFCNCFIGLCLIKNNEFAEGIKKIEDNIVKKIENNIVKKNTEVKEDMILCPLTLERFKDPYITPYGNTYEHAAITQHLKSVGKFDPMTREYLDESMIYPNRIIKEILN